MKRIMHEFEMTEVSAVDKPAQAAAKMLLMKRDDTATLLGDIRKSRRVVEFAKREVAKGESELSEHEATDLATESRRRFGAMSTPIRHSRSS